MGVELDRCDLPVDALVGNSSNPNRMSARSFDLLVDNIQRTGLTEAIVVRPVEDGKYRIVSGHHRHKAALYLGMETVPCTIINDPKFDNDAEMFQLVRMNVIKGRLDPQAFTDLYGKVAGKYGDEILQDMFGFAEEAEFKKLIAATAKGLPKDLKDKFTEAAKEIKTIDGLAQLLNKLFSKYGDTVPYSYMVFDHGGQQNFWIRMTKPTFDALSLIGELCIEEQVSMDDILGEVIRRIAKGDLSEVMQDVVDKAPKVVIPSGFMLTPTKDHLEMSASL